MPRIPLVSTNSADPILKNIFDGLRTAGADPAKIYIYRTIGQAPRLLEAFIGLLNPLLYEAQSPRSLRELSIMRSAQLTHTVYQWARHWGQAEASGVREAQLAQLHRWKESTEFSEEERAVLQLTDEITPGVKASDATFGLLQRLFPTDVVVELTMVAAFYAMVVRVIQTLGIELEPEFPIRKEHMDLMYAAG